MTGQNNCNNAVLVTSDSARTLSVGHSNWIQFYASDSTMQVRFYGYGAGSNFAYHKLNIKSACHLPTLYSDSLVTGQFSNVATIKSLNVGTSYFAEIKSFSQGGQFKVEVRNVPETINEPCLSTVPLCQLVCNGDFEDISTNYPIPVTSPESISILNGWGRPNGTMPGTSDAYWFNGNIGNQLPTLSQPSSNPYGHNGSNGLAGIVTNMCGVCGSDLFGGLSFTREYVTTKLEQAMIFGHFYYAEMYLKHHAESRFYSDKIGMYFSSSIPTQPAAFLAPIAIQVSPQIESNAQIGNSWTNVSGIVNPQSNTNSLNYLTIGNFRDNWPSQDDGTISQFFPKGDPRRYIYNVLEYTAYYLVDDVSVIELPWAGPNKNVCSGDLVAIGEACNLPSGITVQWFGPNNNLLSTQIPFTFSALTSAVYTLQVTYKGHTYTDNVTVNVDCCNKPNMDYEINANTSSWVFGGLSTVSNSDIMVNKSLVIDQSITFDNCNFFMGPDAVLTIAGNVSSSFNNCLFESCDNINMWKGLDVTFANSTLNMSNCILREAKTGVKIRNGATVAISECDFENNYIGLEIMPFAGTVPLSIEKTTFVTNGNLLYPYDGITRGRVGIDINSVGQVSISDPWDLDGFNEFINFDFGIKAIKSNVNVNINHFTNNFYGVFADAMYNTTNNTYAVNIGNHTPEYGNVFTDNIIATYHRRGAYGNSAFNTYIDNTIAGRIHNQPFGVQFTIEHNTLQNNIHGFFISECVKPQFLIDYNSFNSTAPSVPNKYAIRLENVVQPSTSWIPTPPPGWRNSIDITNNTIKDYDNGIQILNMAAPHIEQNNIGRVPSYWSVPTHGVRLFNCPKAEIIDNRVVGTSTSLWAGHGIASDFAVNNLIQGNCVKDLGRGLWVGGQSQGVKIRSNTMEDCNTGFIANWAYIGTQGWPVYDPVAQTGVFQPSDNEWLGITSNHLYNYQPLINNGNEFVLRSPGSIYYKPGHFPSNFSSNSPTGAIMAHSPSMPILNPNLYFGESFCSNYGYSFKTEPGGNTILSAEQVAEIADTSSLNVWVPDDVARAWLRDQALYRELIQDTLNISSSAVLSTFLGTTIQGEVDEVENIDELIRMGIEDSTLQRVATAIALNNALNGTELPLQTSAAFNEIYLPELVETDMNYELSTSQIGVLIGLAAQCPYIYGTAVYQARSLLTLADSNYIPTLSPCELGYQNGIAKTDGLPSDAMGSEKLDIHVNRLKVFPNPASTHIMIMFESSEFESGIFEIISANGQLVFSTQLQTNRNAYIVLPDLANGLYLCTFTTNGERISSEKLVINK